MASEVDPQNLRKTFGRFRVLIMGRANAGKTTILQKVCITTENPEIYNAKGKKIDAAIVEGSRTRGNHDITNELVFKSNPGFVFHDSCGFEAGSEEEFNDMKKFISERVNATKLEERIHAIWYCIPMDDHCRTFQRAEEKFFSECNTGNVPVIAVFTKFEALRPVAFGELKRQLIGFNKLPRAERSERIAQRVEELFTNTCVWDRLCDTRNRARPKCYVCLESMNRADTNCAMLLERTTFALDDEELRLCLVSTQQSNLELCIKCAVETLIDRAHRQSQLHLIDHERYQIEIAKWFSYLRLLTWIGGEDGTKYWTKGTPANFNPALFNEINARKDILLSLLQHLAGKGTWFSTPRGIIQTGIATIIVLEYSALLRHDEELEFIKSGVDYYMNSSTAVAVQEVATEIADGDYKKEELRKKIFEFILENRLSNDLIAKK